MSQSLIEHSKDELNPVEDSKNKAVETTQRNLKNLWALVIASILVIGCLGGTLVFLSGETTHLILTIGIIACAVGVAGIAGYISSTFSPSNEPSTHILNGINALETGILITDAKGKVLFSNHAIQKSFGIYQDAFIQNFIDKFVQSASSNEFDKLLNGAKNQQSIQSEIILSSILEDSIPAIWRIKVNPLPNETGQVIWKFKRLATQQQCLNSKFFQSFMDFQTIFEHAPMGIILLEPNARIVGSNLFFRDKIFKDGPVHNDTLFYDLLNEDCRQEVATVIGKMIVGDKVSMPLEMGFRNQRGQTFSTFFTCVSDKTSAAKSGTKVSGIILHFFDNSEQKKLHLQLVQSQKMQAMGQLAGGIAHDFNNLLTAMIGFCDLLIARHPQGDQSFQDIMHIKQNANRAANLVRQLLAFSKQQTLQPRVLNVADTISDLSTLLHQLVGVNIDLRVAYGRELGLIKVDKGQFEQVIINLVVNARDAMVGEGALIINAATKTYNKNERIHDETIPAGTYVVVEVMDTGCGIDKEILPRIFDPFFSTKELGQGTGLGLSMVYGIIKQTGGYIFVDSEVGQGTKFSVIIPCHEQEVTKAISVVKETYQQKPIANLDGSGTILFVEDEDDVRMFGARALQNKGYKVVEAANGDEALGLVSTLKEKDEESIDLMITDVVMPSMDGPTLVKKAHSICPELKVIYMSGYAEDSFRDKVGKEENIHFLPKPFSLQQLASKVKEVINGHAEKLN